MVLKPFFFADISLAMNSTLGDFLKSLSPLSLGLDGKTFFFLPLLCIRFRPLKRVQEARPVRLLFALCVTQTLFARREHYRRHLRK